MVAILDPLSDRTFLSMMIFALVGIVAGIRTVTSGAVDSYVTVVVLIQLLIAAAILHWNV